MSWQLIILIALGLSLIGLTVATRAKSFAAVAIGFATLLGAQALLFIALRTLDPDGIAWVVPVIAVALLAYNAVRWFLRTRGAPPGEPTDEDEEDEEGLAWLTSEPPDTNPDG